MPNDGRIMKRLLSSVEKIVEKKCRVFCSQNAVKTEPSNDSINQELTALKNEIQSLQNEVKLLADKTDYTIGSLTYISHEYDDFTKKISETSRNPQNILELKLSVDQIMTKQEATEIQIDRLEQYGRRENLELHEIPVTQNENSNQIVRKVASLLDVTFDESQISTSHRLKMPQNPDLRMHAHKNSHPPIIVRFSNREKTNELFAERRLLKEKPQSTISAFGSSQVSLHENLTAYRKSLFRAAKDAKEFL